MCRHMLAVALVCELRKADWKELLSEDGHTPYNKLKSVADQIQDAELKSFLGDLLEQASPADGSAL